MYSVASCEADLHSKASQLSVPAEHAAWQFLLTSAASPFTSQHLARARALAANGLDADVLLELAHAHGLLPVLHQCLLRIAADASPGLTQRVRRAFERNAHQALWLTGLLFDVSELFQQHGIPAIAYKGPVLAQQLYGNVALRQYSDIDLLIRAADVPRARRILQQAGFIAAVQLSAPQEAAYVETGYEYTFHRADKRNVLELQWRILPRFYAVEFRLSKFFQSSQQICLGEKSLSTLANEHLMLVLCAHAAKHAWSKLSWIRDVAELAQFPQIDWDTVLREASCLGIKRMVAMTVWLAMTTFGTPLPSAIEPLLVEDHALAGLADTIRQNVRNASEPALESPAYFRFSAQLRERPVDRLRFWWRLAVTPSVSEWSLVRLPGMLFPLYRTVRVARLARRFFRGR